MDTLTIFRDNNLFTKFRALKIFIDDEFIDYIEPDEKKKIINIPESSSKLNIKLDWCSSNTINLDGKKANLNIRVTSQIQNGLFILIAITFLGGGILNLLDLISPHLGFASSLPMFIIIFWQTIGRKRLMRITKLSVNR